MVTIPGFGIQQATQTQVFGNGIVGIRTECCRNQVGGTSPALRIVLIVNNSVYELLRCSVCGVVLHEQLLVIGVERVAHSNDSAGVIVDLNAGTGSGATVYDSTADIATGEVKDLHQAAIAINKAETNMKMMLEIRNKALSAYKEIARTQI